MDVQDFIEIDEKYGLDGAGSYGDSVEARAKGEAGGGGTRDPDNEEALDSALSHLDGYDEETGGANDPIASGNKGFDAEEWYAEEADEEQRDRLSDKFTDDGELKDSAAGSLQSSNGGLETTSADDSDSSTSSRSGGGSDGSTGGDDLPVSPGLLAAGGVAAVVALRRWS
ncbi:hypothetical protein [Halorientalis halophila]|uniref:hypothetical protein n=1 Tax=Halorientalis halophila TaxID=3108499 RepID=UPI00300A0367